MPDSALAASATRVAVWGHYSGRNLGDELVVGLIVDALRRRRPHAQVAAISMAVADTEARHGIPTYPINPGSDRAPQAGSPADAGAAAWGSAIRSSLRRLFLVRLAAKVVRTALRAAREVPFVIRAYRRLRAIDALIVSGSGQLLDAWQGPWWHPYTTFRWALLARLTGTPMLYPSVGAGPIDHPVSRFLIRKPVDWAAYVTVRDPHSADVLRAIGVERDLSVRPDMGWAWQPASPSSADPSRASAVVGVNPMSHEDPRYWPRGDVRRYQTYVEKLAGFVAHLLAHGHRVVLFSSQPGADRQVGDDLVLLLNRRELAQDPLLSTTFEHTSSVDDLAHIVRDCDYVVAGRFHSVLLPLAMGIPTLGLAYHPKTAQLFVDAGKPERCFDLDQLEVGELVAAFDRMRLEDSLDERRKLRARAAALRVDVERQFDELLGAGERE